MKNMFNAIAKHFNSHRHAAKQALSAYIHARNAFMRDNGPLESDGTPYTAFSAGPRHQLP